jgi:CheY-like chemotaxis protein
VDEILTVALLDDNDDDREMMVMAIEDAGYQVLVVELGQSIDDVVKLVRSHAQALVSDHQLEWAQGASYRGAELVNRCYSERIPAVLVTGYMMDTHTIIREYRRGIPRLVPRNELDGERLREAILAAQLETLDRPDQSREPHLALFRVDRVNAESGQVDVVVPQWNPHLRVPIPQRLLPVAHGGRLEDRRFLAQVNTGAATEGDLYFHEIQPADEPPDDSTLT